MLAAAEDAVEEESVGLVEVVPLVVVVDGAVEVVVVEAVVAPVKSMKLVFFSCRLTLIINIQKLSVWRQF